MLIGDHRQLPPTTNSPEAKFIQGVSLFERLMLTPGFDAILLDLQYRMRASIARWPSSLFYGNRLKDDQSVKDLALIPGFPWPADDSGVAFVHCDGNENQQGNVFWNTSECKAIGMLVRNLLDARVPAEDIGVMTFYEGQRQKLRRNIKKSRD